MTERSPSRRVTAAWARSRRVQVVTEYAARIDASYGGTG